MLKTFKNHCFAAMIKEQYGICDVFFYELLWVLYIFHIIEIALCFDHTFRVVFLSEGGYQPKHAWPMLAASTG
jgi:hypothetical protein